MNEVEQDSKVSVAIVSVTPEMARLWTEGHNNYRKLSKVAVTRYQRIMDNGLWSLSQPLIFDENGLMIDGDHRMNAVMGHGKPVDFVVLYGYNPKSSITFDNGRSRTGADALAHEFPEMLKSSRVQSIVRACEGGLSSTGAQWMRLMNTEFIVAYNKWKPCVDIFLPISTGKGYDVRSAIVAAFCRALNKNPDWEELLLTGLTAYAELKFTEQLEPFRLLRKAADNLKGQGSSAIRQLYGKTCSAILAYCRNQPVTRLMMPVVEPFPCK